MKYIKPLVLVLAALSFDTASAGGKKHFHVLTNNLPENGEIQIVDRTEDGKNQLLQLCQAKHSIWVWPNIGPITCENATLVYRDTLRLKVNPSVKNLERNSGVISNFPFPIQSWHLSEPTPAERNLASQLSRLKGSHRGLLNVPGNVQVLRVAGRGLEFLILPYEHKKRPFTNPDAGEGPSPELTVFRIYSKDGSGWHSIYESDGPPEFFGDMDGDNVPEIRRMPYCDGDCEYYDSFYPARKTLAQWNINE